MGLGRYERLAGTIGGRFGPLNIDQWYTVIGHRKTDGNVYIYVDDSLVGTKPVILGGSDPTVLKAGDAAGGDAGAVVYDYMRVGAVFIAADLDDDTFVDEADVAELTTKWGLRDIDVGWDAAYDLDGSGQIGFGDLIAIRKLWQPDPGAAAASVPEPGSLALLMMGSLVLLVLRRRCRV